MALVYITGNLNKAKYAEKLLGISVTHRKLDLIEVQSLSLQEVVEHKLKAAFDIVKAPVIIDDVSLEFCALGRLPGTFVKFFSQEIGMNGLCKLIGENRRAIARVILGYTDGKVTKFFEGKIEGEIATSPRGDGGFGWDAIFIGDGFGGKTNAELSEDEYDRFFVTLKRLDLLREYLN